VRTHYYLCTVKQTKRLVFRINKLKGLGYDYFQLCSSIARQQGTAYHQEIKRADSASSSSPRKMTKIRKALRPGGRQGFVRNYSHSFFTFFASFAGRIEIKSVILQAA
jgi:hypothetical protein